MKNLESLIFRREEFSSVLKHAADRDLIKPEVQKDIQDSLENNSVSKIIQITGAVWLFDIAVNFTTGGISAAEIFSGNLNQITTIAAAAYFGKLLAGPLLAFAVWNKDEVKNKSGKASALACPIFGGMLFPALALKDHNNFLNFWKVYNKTKKSFRKMSGEFKNNENKVHAEAEFYTKLERLIRKES